MDPRNCCGIYAAHALVAVGVPARPVIAARGGQIRQLCFVSMLIAGALTGSLCAEPANQPPAQGLTLVQAQALALERHPGLQSGKMDTAIETALRDQAARRPNPELSAGAEGFGGSGGYREFGSAETALQLSQTFELGDKRGHRVKVADAAIEIARRSLTSQQREVLTATARLFLDTLAKQQRLALARELLELTRETAATLKARAAAGGGSAVDVARADSLLSLQEAAVERAGRELPAARERLAAQWAGEAADCATLTGALEPLPECPSLAELMQRLEQHPELARLQADLQRSLAEIALERANASADITVGGGVKYLSDTDDVALIVGVSIPLPFNNRNQGAIRAARHRRDKLELDRATRELSLTADLRTAYSQWAAAKADTMILREKTLPLVTQAFELTRTGIEQGGKFTLVDLLDARRTLMETRAQLLEAVIAVHAAAVEIDALTAPAPARNEQD